MTTFFIPNVDVDLQKALRELATFVGKTFL